MTESMNESISRHFACHNEEAIPRQTGMKIHSNSTDHQQCTRQFVKKEYFRSLLPRDREIVQKLHESWFPVKYNNEFYDSLVRSPSRMNSESSSSFQLNNHQHMQKNMDLSHRYRKKEFRIGLYSCVIVEAEMIVSFPNVRNDADLLMNIEEQGTDEEGCGRSSMIKPLLYHPNAYLDCNKNGEMKQKEDTNNGISDNNNFDQSHDLEKGSKRIQNKHLDEKNRFFSTTSFSQDCSLSLCTTLHENRSSLPPPTSNEEQILGCIIGTFVPISKISENTLSLLISDQDQHPFLFYIMTLGTIVEKRHQGYGRKLIQQCIQMLEMEENQQCGCIYLHVITYNKGAIRFYESLGFQRITEIEGYYTIDNEKHNCYLYAKYINGNALLLNPGARVVSYLSDSITTLWKCVYLKISYYTSFFRIWNQFRN